MRSLLKTTIEQIKKFGKTDFIKGELIKRKIEINEIASDLKVSPVSVYLTIRDRMVSKRIASYIEDIIEVPRGSLFPYTKERRENSND